jgi:sugar phosphate isomerase/epimerase
MRLGGTRFRPETVADLDSVAEVCDVYGLSAVSAPNAFTEMTDGEAVAFGERARALGLVVGEAVARPNLMVRDDDLRAARIAALRTGLVKAELMGCHGVIVLVGTVGPEDHLAAPHPYMYTAECRLEFREILLRAVDGLELLATKLLVEPWTTSFFYQPAAIREFLESVDHPAVGVHLDQMNMVDQQHYYRTTELIDETFDLLASYVGGVHFKDVRWDWRHMLLKFDEVPVGDGVLDYHTYLRRVAELDDDLTCFCEHFPTEGDYAVSFARLHRIAAELGTGFLRRDQQRVSA